MKTVTFDLMPSKDIGECDMAQVSGLASTNNVVEFMVQQLQKAARENTAGDSASRMYWQSV